MVSSTALILLRLLRQSPALTVPVVLLTGTFEPFDPDRAEKAGCDAVVTKPFESQSLIHKVEELIAQASSTPAATTAAVEAAPEPAATIGLQWSWR